MNNVVLKEDAEKRELIEQLSRDGKTLWVFYDEQPGGSFDFESVRDGVTAVHPPYDYDALEEWWYEGNWQAITPPTPGFEPFDTFKAAPSRIEAELVKMGIVMIIDSFHDDIEWHVIRRD